LWPSSPYIGQQFSKVSAFLLDLSVGEGISPRHLQFSFVEKRNFSLRLQTILQPSGAKITSVSAPHNVFQKEIILILNE
jgi:hypothetical protein